MTFSNRKFGVEIEFTFNSRVDVLAQQISTASGFTVVAESYNHTRQGHWKIVRDGSCGWELVSPPLSGVEGLQQVKKVVRALAGVQGVRVDRNCGLHVHVDGAGLSVNDIRNIINRYSRFESTIDSFMPVSRRANNNQYCRTLTSVMNNSYIRERFNSAVNPRQLADYTAGDRYLKVNLLAYLRHGTIEFRQHSGSVNASKIINWVKFCVAFVEASRMVEGSRPRTEVVAGRRRMNRSNKLRALAVLLRDRAIVGQGGRIDNAYIMESVGLQENTLSSYLSTLRNRFGWRIPRRGGLPYISSYTVGQIPGDDLGVGPVAARQVAAPVANDSWQRGIDASVVSYLEERALDFNMA